jgi:two-component system, LytTR family, response regulator
MIRVMIIDDEPNAVRTLQSYIQRYTQNVEVVATASSKQEAVKRIPTVAFDLLLLDINLGDGTGFQVLEEIENQVFATVFTTAYDEHAIKAFKYSAVDYLLKPINPEEFVETINRVASLHQKTNRQQTTLANELNKGATSKKLVINSSNEIHFLQIEDIIRLESYKNYTDIYLQDGQKITSSKTLKFYETLLEEYAFFRVHQRHLVPTKHVVKFLKEDGGYVLLSNGDQVEVSRRKKEQLLNHLTHTS